MIHLQEEESKKAQQQAETPAPAVELAPSEATIAQERAEEATERFVHQTTKQVVTAPLQPAVAKELTAALRLLTQLREEIEGKRDGALEKRGLIRAKILSLRDSGKVNVDEAEFEKSDTSVQEFVHLLERMVEEVTADEAFYTSLLQDNRPAQVQAFITEPDDFQVWVKERINLIKRYVKAAKRDLAVSYSRYCFGFDVQIRQISYVERVVTATRRNS